MARESVQHAPSSNIAGITWDSETMDLLITFRKGALIRYLNVDEETVRGFASAMSATQYLNTAIVGQFMENRIS
jgi:hypothetical protein